MLKHKLVLDEIEDDFFKLIALHGSIEEYRLAFLLNKHLNLQLARTRQDLDFTSAAAHVKFPLYEYFDSQKHCRYYLIANRAQTQKMREPETTGLFKGESQETKPFYLLPEFQHADFFLKIEEEGNSVSERELMEGLKEIPQLATAYRIDSNRIKSKTNLIFD